MLNYNYANVAEPVAEIVFNLSRRRHIVVCKSVEPIMCNAICGHEPDIDIMQ